MFLLKKYQELKEAGSTSSFPNVLANTMYKILLSKFKGVNSPWRKYVMKTSVSDFKANDRVIIDEAPDLLEITEDGPYKDSNLGDHKYQIQLTTFGRTFSIGRRVIINDDLNAMRAQPARHGRAAGRTLAKSVVKRLEENGVTYDSKALFHADHNNKVNGTVTNDAAGYNLLATAMTGIENATDETGEKMGLMAKYALVPPALEDTVLRMVRGREIVPVSTSGGSNSAGKAARLEVIVDPFLTLSNRMYIMADPEDAPTVEVTFLRGKETPDLLVKKAEAVSAAGGADDPWGFEFDEIIYKVRYDFQTKLAMYQGIQLIGG